VEVWALIFLKASSPSLFLALQAKQNQFYAEQLCGSAYLQNN